MTLFTMTSCHHQMTVDQQVDALYEKMSQKERIAQLRSTYMDDLFDAEGHLDTNKCRELIPDGIGHFSQYASQAPMDPNVLRDRVAAVQEWLIHNTPNGIPALFPSILNRSDKPARSIPCLLKRKPCRLVLHCARWVVCSRSRPWSTFAVRRASIAWRSPMARTAIYRL